MRDFQSDLEDKFQKIFEDIIEDIRGGGGRYKRETNLGDNFTEQQMARVIFNKVHFLIADTIVRTFISFRDSVIGELATVFMDHHPEEDIENVGARERMTWWNLVPGSM